MAPVFKNSDFDEQPPKAKFQRDSWYGIQYKTHGPFTQDRKKVDDMAHDAIAAYVGAQKCYGTAPEEYRSGARYAVLRQAAGNAIYERFELLEASDIDEFTYVATVFIQLRNWSSQPPNAAIEGDAIIFDKHKAAAAPTF